MRFVPTTLLTVYLDGRKRLKVGRLALSDRRILFEYDPGFLSAGLAISPFQLPLKAGVQVAPPGVFEGVFGVFNDSLPDGWGRLLLDRALERSGIAHGQLTPLDRLAHVGRSGMGGLSYEPDLTDTGPAPAVLQLEKIASDAAKVLAGAQGPVIEQLLKLNGASAGARPKVVAQVSADRKKLLHGGDRLADGYSHWMIKFPSANDAKDVGRIEYAYSLMARQAGLIMPETHLFGAKAQKYFGIQRFDRDGDRRIHMHSLSGLIHADHRVPSTDYDTLLKVAHVLTKDIREVEKAFRLACFNVLAHNRDDHAKNVSFLMDDKTGQWMLAPAYDLVFSYGPGGEQSMMVMGEGKAPGVSHLRDLGRKHSLKNAEAIIGAVQTAVSQWHDHADAAGVSKTSAKMIAAKILPPAIKPAAAKAKEKQGAQPQKKRPAKTPPSSSRKKRPKR